MPQSARKTHWWSTGGPWGTGLLLLGVAVTVQGISYTSPRPHNEMPAPLHALATAIPFSILGAVWIAAGLWAVWKALTPPQQHRDVVPVVTVTSLWALTYLAYWLVVGIGWGEWTREWVGGVGWGSLTVLIISWGRCVNPPVRRR